METQRCDACEHLFTRRDLNRLNPPPFVEIIICNDCMEWEAWKYLDQTKFVLTGTTTS